MQKKKRKKEITLRHRNNNKMPNLSYLPGLHSLHSFSLSLSFSAVAPLLAVVLWSCAALHMLACSTRRWAGNEAPSCDCPHSKPESQKGKCMLLYFILFLL